VNVFRRHLTIAVFVALMATCFWGCTSNSGAKNSGSAISATEQVHHSGFTAHYPAGWLPSSPPANDRTVAFVAIGASPGPGQPRPQYVVRYQDQSSNANLTQSIKIYEEIAKLRNPSIRFDPPEAVKIPNSQFAVLLVANYVAGGPPTSAAVRTVDLFVETSTGRPAHLFESGPPSELTPAAIDRTVLSFVPT
jgi:hypothetical protein